MAKMNEAALISQIEQLESHASNYFGTDVASEQATAMDYYLRKPFGTEEEGRSQVVSSDVWDVVEGLTPLVLKPFVSTDDIVRFNPEGAEDEEAAEQESDYLNYVITQKNDVFMTLVEWVKTGLLQKNGVVKYWWDKSKRTSIERYEGISDDLYTELLKEPDVSVLEHSETNGQPSQDETGQMVEGELLHDVVLRVSKPHGEAKYCVIPPEEFLISRNAVSPNPQKAAFVEHRTRKSISDIRAMGYDVDDDISDTGSEDPAQSPQALARQQNNDYLTGNDQTSDPASREVLFRDIYMLVDYDGDGLAELRNICMVGREVLKNEETEEVPFCGWTPYQQLFKFYGRCPADEATEIQLGKSTLMRQNLDNIYTINNNRVFASDKVNLDDLLDNQIAGVVRVKGDVVSNHVMSATIQPIGGIIQPMLEYYDSIKENRTGFTRYNQGSDSDSLNKTATGIRIIAEAGNERVNLVSRSFAEMGLKPLMLGIHGLCRRHATKAETVRLRGKWVTINPRNWKTRYDMTVSVGLGNSDMQMKMQGAQMVLEKQMMLMETGIVTPDNFYQAARKLAEAVGEKNPDKYFTSPKEKEGQQQGPDPQTTEQIQQLSQALESAAAEVEKLEQGANDKAGELKIKQVEANTKAYQAITARLSMLAPLLMPEELGELVQETRREAMEQPDPGMSPSESMGIPEQLPDEPQMQAPPDPQIMQQPEQPADAGFFTPDEQGGMNGQA